MARLNECILYRNFKHTEIIQCQFINTSVDSPSDLTGCTEELSEKYDKNYYSRLCRYLDGITEEEADCMINTIEKFYKVMSERRVDIE